MARVSYLNEAHCVHLGSVVDLIAPPKATKEERQAKYDWCCDMFDNKFTDHGTVISKLDAAHLIESHFAGPEDQAAALELLGITESDLLPF